MYFGANVVKTKCIIVILLKHIRKTYIQEYKVITSKSCVSHHIIICKNTWYIQLNGMVKSYCEHQPILTIR